MNKPSLLILSFSDIAADARVLKQVRLFRDDYDLHTCGYGNAPEGVSNHIEIPAEMVVWRYNRRAVLMRRYPHAYWTNGAINFARTALSGRRFDAVLANDIDSVGLALDLGPVHGVHADLHEYAPRQKDDLLRWRLFVAPFIRWMCRSFATRAASVTTVGEGIADEYRRRFGIDARVVTNAAPYADLTPGAVGDPIRLVHSGACLRDRNIGAILDAVEASASAVSLDLFLTPNDPGYLGELRQRAERSSRITLHDPVPYSELSDTLNAFDIGVHVLPPVNFNNRWALPNKFFDYVQARLGVLIGPSPEMARVLQERAFGAVADDFSVEALTRQIDLLDANTVESWKRAADAAARDLSSDSQVVVWQDSISKLLGQRRVQ